jgi:hypothetical protein
MKPANNLKALCYQFCESVSILKGRVKLIPFDRDAWFQCAYASIQRTVLGELHPDAQDRLKTELFDEIDTLRGRALAAEGFNEWIVRVIKKQSETHALSIGQSQMLINLILKYYYCHYAAEIDPRWNEDHKFISEHSSFFHIPMDNNVLVRLKVNYACPDIHIKKTRAYATIRIDDSLVSWSRLEDLPAYMRLQRFAQEMMGNHLQAFDNAIHFELSELAR